MIEYDQDEKKMVLKLVYYGPALSGKTTNLLCLHDLLAQDGRGELMVLDTANERTIYFDLLPFFLKAPSGLTIKVKIFTVPGQVKHDATRKAVLQRADGVAFIADSQVKENLNNTNSFENLERNMALVGMDVEKTPLVIQFNKRDLNDVIAEAEIRGAWDASGIPVFMASALEGWGIIETLRSLAESTYRSLDARYGLEADHGLSLTSFVAQLVRCNQNKGL